MISRVLMFAALGAALVGCAGKPSVYYTLTPSVDDQAPSNVTATVTKPYTIGSVSVPAPVDDSLIVVRSSDDRLMKLAHDRWTAPLSKQVNNALAVALTRELGMPPLSRAQAGANNQKMLTISVDVQRFDLVPGRYAELAAIWQVAPADAPGKKPELVCYTEVRETVQPGVAPLVMAQQFNIQKLAKAVSLGLRTGQPGEGTRCQ